MAEKERKTKRVQLLFKPSCYEAYKATGAAAGYNSFTETVEAALNAFWFTQTRLAAPERRGFENV